MAPGKRDFKPRKGGGPPGRLHKTAKKKGKPAKLPSLKNQIRGVQRLLQKVGWAALEAWPPAMHARPARAPCQRCEQVRSAVQEGLEPKARQKQEERLRELLAAKQEHERAERERKFAKRYHKAGLARGLRGGLFLRCSS